jgi:hypothetical protein
VKKLYASPPVKLGSVVKKVPLGIIVAVFEGLTDIAKRATAAVPRRLIAPKKGPIHSVKIF